MALNQSVRLPAGLSGLVACVEAPFGADLDPDELGRTTRYWNADPDAPFWTTAPVANLPVEPDPFLDGVYLVKEATERMTSWTAGPYRVTVLDSSGNVLAGPDDIWVIEQDDRV